VAGHLRRFDEGLASALGVADALLRSPQSRDAAPRPRSATSSPVKLAPVFGDLELARRIEGADAANGAAFVAARAQSAPEAAAVAEPLLGGYALFSGVDSPVNQALGVGLAEPVEPAGLERLERFFLDRGVPAVIEVCPFVAPAFLALLAERSFRPVEFSNVLARPLGAATPAPPAPIPAPRVEPVGGESAARWACTVLAAFSEGEEAPPGMDALFADCTRAVGAVALLAEVDGAPAGGGMVQIHRDVAILSGHGTLPAFRGRGVQNALFRESLRIARAHGCDLAATMTLPGTGSQRNAERHGFRVVYTRLKAAKASP
jgi:GNAT superfamily N-acetyltransferase